MGGWRLLRLGVLTVLLAWSFVLLRWNRDEDPRFFAFLETRPGQVLSVLFGWWSSPLDRPSPEKPDAKLSEAERKVKAEMEAELRERVNRARDVAVGYYAPRVSYRDVAFRMEFPALHLYVRPPFVVLSDAGTGEVNGLLEVLGSTYRGFTEVFHPLFADVRRDDLIHLLYFRNPADYLAYQKDRAAGMDHTSGFYSPVANRLVLYRQDGGPPGAEDVEDATETLHTIRHEAAHQFLFAHGVHSRHRIENDWLIEGLAGYCESERVGEADPDQAAQLRAALGAGRLVPLDELVNHRAETGLLGYRGAELAYGQSWSLVHFLMQPERRDAFFDYIRYLRDPKNFRAVKRADRFDLLADRLGMSRPDLHRQWREHVRGLQTNPADVPGA